MTKKETKETDITLDSIIVKDPQSLRPVDLPLVITPPEGKEWANTEQAEYAKILNAAAYRNPTKWAVKKEVEIARLIEIGSNPDAYYIYTGIQRGASGAVTYSNKLLT